MASPGCDLPVEVPADAMTLVAGPPMTGKYDLMLELLAARADSAIVITTAKDPDTVADDFTAAGAASDRVGVVACTGGDEDDGTEDLKRASLDNLTGVGVAFTELFETFYGDGTSTGVGVHSLSPMLMHAELSTVYRFLQVLAGRVRTAGWPGVVVVNATATDDRTLATLTQQFDGVIRTREGEGGRELRVKGFDAPASGWRPF